MKVDDSQRSEADRSDAKSKAAISIKEIAASFFLFPDP
jgi:hypothetical protein